jgi:hypothetical protein
MALPDATLTIADGALGQGAATGQGAHLKMGMCSDGIVGTLYGFGDIGQAQATLGQGPLVDAIAHALAIPGQGTVYALPLNPTTAGSSGTITHTGPGTGTVTASTAPRFSVAIKIGTGGTNGTATFQVSLNGGAYGAVISTTGGTFSYLVPGTVTTVTLASGQTWVANDIYTIATDGSVTLTGSGPAASNVTHTDSPLDAYNVLVTITTAGGLGVGVFTYSVDGGNNTSEQIAIPSGAGKYQLPNTGVVLTFAGTFTAGDTYSWTTTHAAFNNTDLTNGFTTALAGAAVWGFVHVVGTGANSAAAATMTATVQTQMVLGAAQFRFARAIVQCPTSESDSTVASAFAAVSADRVNVCAGDVGAISPINGRILQRNCAYIVAAHAGAIPVGEDLGYVGTSFPVRNVASLYRDEAKTPALDAARFTTMRTFPGRQGYYITRGLLMAPSGSDFAAWDRGRVMDVACAVTRAGELPYVNGTMRVDPKTGYIDERDAQAFEAKVNSQLRTALVSTGQASATSVVVSRASNILSTSTLPVNVRVTPLGKLTFISTTIGFVNPALAA